MHNRGNKYDCHKIAMEISGVSVTLLGKAVKYTGLTPGYKILICAVCSDELSFIIVKL